MTVSLLTSEFWTTAVALHAIGLVAALIILVWDWRLSLPGLALVQFGLGQIFVYRYGLPGQWTAVYFWVVVLAGFILSLSPIQMGRFRAVDRSGNFMFRGLLLVLSATIVYSLPLDLPIPVVDESTAHLLLWLVTCALLILALTEKALFTGIGLLLWLVPLQSFLAVILPFPAIIGLLGSVEILIALACSYLAVAENVRLADSETPMTDITFPSDSGAPEPSTSHWWQRLQFWFIDSLDSFGSLLSSRLR